MTDPKEKEKEKETPPEEEDMDVVRAEQSADVLNKQTEEFAKADELWEQTWPKEEDKDK